jgi:putative transcriptional regulator
MQNRLKDLRQRQKMSQSDLARKLGVSRQAVNGFESGKFDPSLEMAFKLATLFNVAIEEIFIYEAKNSMQVIVDRVKDFFGFRFGFERFTDKAVNAVKFAHNQAVLAQQPEVGPEQLLFGLLADPTTTSARLLRANGLTLEVETDEHSFEYRQEPRLSQESKFVMELALQVVRLNGKKSIGTEHLLWGLVRLAETDNAALNDSFQRYALDLPALNRQLAEAV